VEEGHVVSKRPGGAGDGDGDGDGEGRPFAADGCSGRRGGVVQLRARDARWCFARRRSSFLGGKRASSERTRAMYKTLLDGEWLARAPLAIER